MTITKCKQSKSYRHLLWSIDVFRYILIDQKKNIVNVIYAKTMPKPQFGQ